jgi:hypothetical protein
MEFTDNEKDIIKKINEIGSELSFERFFKNHLSTRGIVITPLNPYGKIELKGNNIKEEVKQICSIWRFLELHILIDIRQREYTGRDIQVSGDKQLSDSIYLMINPLWDKVLTPQLELQVFIDNNYKTKEEIAFNYEKKHGEKALFWTRWAVVISAIGLVASAIFNYASLLISTNNTHVVHDTVKIMYYNPPKDTMKLK